MAPLPSSGRRKAAQPPRRTNPPPGDDDDSFESPAPAPRSNNRSSAQAGDVHAQAQAMIAKQRDFRFYNKPGEKQMGQNTLVVPYQSKHTLLYMVIISMPPYLDSMSLINRRIEAQPDGSFDFVCQMPVDPLCTDPDLALDYLRDKSQKASRKGGKDPVSGMEIHGLLESSCKVREWRASAIHQHPKEKTGNTKHLLLTLRLRLGIKIEPKFCTTEFPPKTKAFELPSGKRNFVPGQGFITHLKGVEELPHESSDEEDDDDDSDDEIDRKSLYSFSLTCAFSVFC